MEQLSKIAETIILPLEINIPLYIFDHHFGELTVIPAVESCQVLASNIVRHMPNINALNIYNASFNKLIEVEPGQTAVRAFNQLDIYEDGSVISKLLTKKKLKKSVITRTIEHVKLKFRKDNVTFEELTYDVASALDGVCLQIPSDKIYKELILFGSAYHNISDIIYVSHYGVIANVFAAPHGKVDGPLGSPFVFDAALHAANIWAQRYFNTIGFPIGFKKRIIQKPTIPGEKYFTRIIPVQDKSNNLIFDIWIFDFNGNLYEAAFGVQIKDIYKTILKPPEWITRETNETLKYISLNCEAHSIVEIESVLGFAVRSLSSDELLRQESMMEKRRKSYISARLACKFLSRKLAKEHCNIPAHEIITISDNKYPRCPLPDGSNPYRCSVSHDSRFAIAAASHKRIGVDVEEISERILKSMHFYISSEEKQLVDSSELDKKEACLRIWSIKEAVTKALDIKLMESWKIVKVSKIGRNISTLLFHGNEIKAYHDTIDNHLFTLVKIENMEA